MAVITNPKDSVVTIKFDCGVNLDGENEYITKSYSGIKHDASNENIMAFVSEIQKLQKHFIHATNRKDYTTLSE